MTLRHHRMLVMILDRIAEPGDDAQIAFTFEDIRRWPTGAVDALVAGRFLKVGLPADAITCRGCERRCLRPVMLVEAGADRASTLTSTCHLKPDMGPFEHLAERLMRWTCSREGVARFIGRNWRVQIQDYDNRWRRVRFGTVQLAGVRGQHPGLQPGAPHEHAQPQRGVGGDGRDRGPGGRGGRGGEVLRRGHAAILHRWGV